MIERYAERAFLQGGAVIREATRDDVETVLRHRRGMFEDMGFRR